MEQAGGRTVGGVTLVVPQRCFQRLAQHGMKESRRVVIGEHLESDEAGGQAHSGVDLHARQPSRVTEVAAVAEHGQRLGKVECLSIEAPDPSRHLPGESDAGPRDPVRGVVIRSQELV
jgi:hypothetical protein